MLSAVTITAQGQVTIPATMRRILKLETTKMAQIELENNDHLVIRPIKDFLSLKGKLKKYAKRIPQSTDPIDAENKAIEDFYAKTNL